ncbi:MAG: cell division protein ZapA [Chlorobi bacterium]|nr:cell division protein ZapA [Chlorobiota bacterium]
MEDKFTIRVNVADRYYPLKITRSDEETIRRAARLINEKILQYKQRYVEKDLQDFLAMAALQFVVKLMDCEEKQDVAPIMEDIEALNKELDEYLKNV